MEFSGFGNNGRFGNFNQEPQKSRQEKEAYALELMAHILKNTKEVDGWVIGEKYGCISASYQGGETVDILATPFFEGISHTPYNYNVGYITYDCESTKFNPRYDLKKDSDRYIQFLEFYIGKIETLMEQKLGGFSDEERERQKRK